MKKLASDDEDEKEERVSLPFICRIGISMALTATTIMMTTKTAKMYIFPIL